MANPKHENILRFCNRSFMIRHDRIHYKDETGYHVHPEMELALLEGGGGVRTMNGIDEMFGSLDVVLVPGNTPHCWTFDAGQCPAEGMVNDCSCQFSSSLLLHTVRVFPEFREMADFYTSLRQAIQITGETALYVRRCFAYMSESSDIRQTLKVMEMLAEIYERREYRMVGSPVAGDTPECRADVRFYLIDRLVSENYSRKITLREAAEAVGMSPTSFCNAFKSMTGITFNKYLTSYRMRIASSLLRDTDLNIGEIGYRVGYGDLPHFTRAFVSSFHKTPSQFRRDALYGLCR